MENWQEVKLQGEQLLVELRREIRLLLACRADCVEREPQDTVASADGDRTASFTGRAMTSRNSACIDVLAIESIVTLPPFISARDITGRESVPW